MEKKYCHEILSRVAESMSQIKVQKDRRGREWVGRWV